MHDAPTRRPPTARSRLGQPASRVLVRIHPDPADEHDPELAWAQGCDREHVLGERFDADAEEHGDLIVLHDRRHPDSPTTLDHVVIGPSGVWVVVATDTRGPVRHVDMGGWLRSDWQLTVAGRDRTSLALEVAAATDLVRTALDRGPVPDVPVRGALCFVRGEFGWRFRPIEVHDVLVTWPRSIRSHARADGPLGPLLRAVVAAGLEAELPPA